MGATYTLRDRGHDLVVETWVEPAPAKKRNRARLLVDGSEVDTGSTDEIGDVRLGVGSDHPTTVGFWWTGRVGRVDLVEPGLGHERHRRTPYMPPAGTRAARRHAWAERHPRLHASRHVVANLAGTLAAIVGIGFLIRLVSGLLPSIDGPDIDPPDWLEYLDPSRYLAPLFSWVPPLMERLFGWIPDAGWVKYVVGFLFAVGVAVTEYRRRRRREEQRDETA